MPSNDHCWCGSGGVSWALAQNGVGAKASNANAATMSFAISGLRQRHSGAAKSSAAALQHRCGDAGGERFGFLEPPDDREQDQEMDEVVQCGDLPDGYHQAFGRVGADPGE